jgi:hypothetical protein
MSKCKQPKYFWFGKPRGKLRKINYDSNQTIQRTNNSTLSFSFSPNNEQYFKMGHLEQ